VRTRIGVIGCGEVTQIIHLPTLSQLSDRFEVTALCDVSANVRRGVGDLWGIDRRFGDARDLLALPDVDAVLVANPDPWHADTTLAAVEANKDVLVEKPMCLGPRECGAIVAAAERTGAIVQVGYMRRHAAAMAEAKRALGELGEVRFARAHDVVGPNRVIVDGTSRVVRADDVAADAGVALGERRRALVEEALGPLSPTVARAYDLLLGLGSHDLSAMRELLGEPRGVGYATARGGGEYVSASIDYGGFVCQFDLGVDEIPRYDTFLEVYGARRVLRIRYDTPYVRNLPTRLETLEASGRDGVSERSLQPSWGDPFVAQWQAFHDCVTERRQPVASAADFRRDLDLFGEMIGLMRRDEHA
jgi:predicted dehydrogenase